MTKEELLGQAFLKITGGSPSPENTTWLSDLSTYLPPAVNKVMLGTYDVSGKDASYTGVNPLFLQVFDDVAVTFDAVKQRYKASLTRKTISFPQVEGIQYVGTPTGKQFNKFFPQNNTIGSFYWKVNSEVTSYSVEGDTIYLYNYSPAETPLMIKQVVHVEDIADTDEILLPSGTEIEVINMIVAFFLEQRSTPHDSIIDGRDGQ